MELENNPLLQPENYWKDYQKNIEALKNKPEIIEFDKLCYELFEHQETGRHFMQLITDRYLIPTLVSKGNPTYQIDVLWQEGFKDFIRMLLVSIKSHQHRINAQGTSLL